MIPQCSGNDVMATSRLVIRRASILDCEALGNLSMRTWHISLKDLVPGGFLQRFELDALIRKYAQRAAASDWDLFLAECDGKIVGMISVTDNYDEPQIYKKQIKSMYVDPDHQRAGVGSALLNAMFEHLRVGKVENVMLWCIRHNSTAANFYLKFGGRKIENIEPPEEYAAMQHVVFAWDLLP
jgi:GNAT superfamily N-acetyltransferase